MSRPWRIEFSGALYHVLSRGNAQGDLFLDDDDRNDFIGLIGEISKRFDVNVFAYVLMDNHISYFEQTAPIFQRQCSGWV
jgi:putative transposase